MIDDDLIIGQHHRECHDTEYEGAVAIGPKVETLRSNVLALFHRYGPMTDDELMDRYVMTYGDIYKNSLEPRRYELVQAGQLEKTGEKRRGKSGVKRIVWQLAGPPGQKELFQ